MSNAKDLLLWIYWHPFKTIIQSLPIPCVYFLGRILGKCLFYVAPGKRSRLIHAFSLIDVCRDMQKLSEWNVKEAFVVHTQNEFEVLLFPVLSKRIISSLVSISGLHNLDYALSKGRGVMLLFAHFGANQLIMPAIGFHGYRMCQLSAPATVWKEKLPNKIFSKMEDHALSMRWHHEASLPVKHINIFGSLKEAFLCLKRNELLGVAIDGGGGTERVSVKFLGKEALFSIGAMDIARRTGCTVLPTFTIRTRRGKNTLVIEPPLEIVGGENPKEIIKLATQRFALILENYVKKHPSHYMNFLELRTRMAALGDIPFFPEVQKSMSN